MNFDYEKWQRLKQNYLKQVEQALAAINHPKTADVLCDVDEHLERKYAELPPDKQNWEGCQQILTEMGPPQEYADLLMQETQSAAKNTSGVNTFLAIVFVIVLMSVGGYLIYTAKNAPALPPTSESSARAFEPDEQVIGKWIAVDFVRQIEDFRPGEQQWNGDLYLKGLTFYEDGTTSGPWTWTKGWLLHSGDHTGARYVIKQMQNATYLFMEWISEDVTLRRQQPWYYVLKKQTETERSPSDSSAQIPVHVDQTPAAFVISFKQVSEQPVRTARQLLDMFNQNHPSGVRTHHYRTKIVEDELIGGICVDSQANADAISQMLEQNDNLELLAVEPVTQDEFENYCRLRQVSLPLQSDGPEQPPVVWVDLPAEGIDVDNPNCTAGFAQSRLGTPARVDYDGRLLRYTDRGLDLWFSENGTLSEIRLNPGFKGNLNTGISLSWSREEVFQVYGEPLNVIEAADLHRKNDERILYRKDDVSRIYYGNSGLIFWFKGDTINQIVLFKGGFNLNMF